MVPLPGLGHVGEPGDVMCSGWWGRACTVPSSGWGCTVGSRRLASEEVDCTHRPLLSCWSEQREAAGKQHLFLTLPQPMIWSVMTESSN